VVRVLSGLSFTPPQKNLKEKYAAEIDCSEPHFDLRALVTRSSKNVPVGCGIL
jgi:hypothetical protein